METDQKISEDRRQLLASQIENFQQAAAVFAGPYADAEETIFRFAYGTTGKGGKADPTMTKDDVQTLIGLMESLIVDAENLEQELQSAYESFVELVDEFEQDDEDAEFDDA